MSRVRIVTQLREHLQDPLYKNSYFLMATSGATAILGVVFWIVVARLYSPDQVGLATALISAIGLVGVFCKLGFDFGLIRFLPQESDRKGMINSCFTVAGLFSLLLAIIFVAGLDFWSPALLFVQKDITILLLFIVFTPISTLLMLQASAFVGMRSAKFSFVQTLIANVLRLPLPIILVSLGVLGIFFSWGVAICVALIAALFLFTPRVVSGYYPVPMIKKKVVTEMAHFSAGNYVAEIFDSIPGVLLPLMIVNVLSAEMAAYFFMAWAIANLLVAIPIATMSSLLAEGSYDPIRFRKNVIRAIKFLCILLIPAILGIIILGDKLLLLFGSEYSQNALTLLWMLALAAIPVAITRVYVTIKRVQLKIRPIMAIYAFIAIGTLALSYSLMTSIGLLGTGIAWLAVQVIMAAVVGWLVLKKERWIAAKR